MDEKLALVRMPRSWPVKGGVGQGNSPAAGSGDSAAAGGGERGERGLEGGLEIRGRGRRGQRGGGRVDPPQTRELGSGRRRKMAGDGPIEPWSHGGHSRAAAGGILRGGIFTGGCSPDVPSCVAAWICRRRGGWWLCPEKREGGGGVEAGGRSSGKGKLAVMLEKLGKRRFRRFLVATGK